MTFDAAVLAQQLAAMGTDLGTEIKALAILEEACVDAEADYRRADNRLEDAQAKAFLASRGSNAEARKAESRLAAGDERAMAEIAWREWQKLKANVRTQMASIQALHRRVEIGRSLLSREKALIALGE